MACRQTSEIKSLDRIRGRFSKRKLPATTKRSNCFSRSWQEKFGSRLRQGLKTSHNHDVEEGKMFVRSAVP